MMTTEHLIGKRLAVAVFVAVFIALAGFAQAQTNVYVSADGSDGNNGQTWETAKKTLAAGIGSAGANGTVFVKAGNYTTTAEFTVPAGVTVMGGYRLESEGTDTSLRRLPGTNVHWTDTTYCTILGGEGTHRIATVIGTLEGCVVRNGFTTTLGGGVLIDGGTVRYCVIKECVATEPDDATAEGGGAYVRNDGTLINCVVTACRADNGAAVSGESGSLINNTITRNGSLECSSVTDYDGNVYHAVQIGSQCWMAENLRTTHYADGSAVAYYLNYNLDQTTYGLFYTWNAVMNGASSSGSNPSGVQGVCPDGWHVPSNLEWGQLTGYMSIRSQYLCNNIYNNISKSLASASGWGTPCTGTCYPCNDQSANNSSGFNAFPAGFITDSGSANYAHSGAYFWTSRTNSNNSTYGVYVKIYESERDAQIYNNSSYSKNYRMSVRCVRD